MGQPWSNHHNRCMWSYSCVICMTRMGHNGFLYPQQNATAMINTWHNIDVRVHHVEYVLSLILFFLTKCPMCVWSWVVVKLCSAASSAVCISKQARHSRTMHTFDQDGSLIFHKHGLQAMLTSGRGREKGPAGGLAVAVGQLRPVVKGEDLSGNGTAFICVGRHGFKQLLVEPKVFEGEQKKRNWFY